MHFYRFINYSLLTLIFLVSCKQKNERPYILYINSYHEGYGSSDEITKGIKETLSGKDVDLTILYMDSKRHPENTYLQKISGSIVNMIQKGPPDLIICSDDNAVKYIVSAGLKEVNIPIVFCGINWSAETALNILNGVDVARIPVTENHQIEKWFNPGLAERLNLTDDVKLTQKIKIFEY